MLDLFVLRHAERIKHSHQTLRAEQPHQIILQRKIELRLTRISLTSGSSAQLVVDTARLVALRSDDLKSARRLRLVVQLYIGSSSCHIGRDRDRTMLSGQRHDLCLLLMELRVEHGMRDSLPLEHRADQLGGLDRDGSDENRLSLCMGFLYRLHDRVELLLLRLVNGILQIDTSDRTVGRNLNDVHPVNIAELLLLRQRRTGHAGFLVKFVKEILEGDRRERLALSFHLHMLLRLDRLMQSVRITASRHDTTGKLIDDQHLIIRNHVVLIAKHQIVRTQRQNDVVLDLQILRIRQVIDMKEILDLMHTLLRQIDDLVLLIDDEVAALLLLDAHQRVHFGVFRNILAALQLACQNIAGFVQLCRFSA